LGEKIKKDREVWEYSGKELYKLVCNNDKYYGIVMKSLADVVKETKLQDNNENDIIQHAKIIKTSKTKQKTNVKQSTKQSTKDTSKKIKVRKFVK